VIPFDFDYYRPSSLHEAVQLFQTLHGQKREPLYYCGGTEIITLARLSQLQTSAVIDIKGIPECSAMYIEDGQLVVGSAVTLTAVSDSGLFPLLGKTCTGIADRTARNKITFGGNICSRIMYREAILPLLLADSVVVIAGLTGVRQASIHQVFVERMRLHPGEFLVRVHTQAGYTQLPSVHVKRRRIGSVGYPVVTLAALKKDGRIRIALSGVCDFPFRSLSMEAILAETSVPLASRVELALRLLPAPPLDDLEASAEFRTFALRNALMDGLQALEGVSA
jgi:CO/xanthine dehydrogenase FAD-binding subunit